MGLAEKILTIMDQTGQTRTGPCSRIVLVPYEQAYATGFEDMHRRVPDIDKIAGYTGWAPRRNLGEILEEVIESFRNIQIGRDCAN